MAEQTGQSGPPERKTVSGRLVVIVLFTGALLMWGIVFMVGLRKRSERGGMEPQTSADSAVSAEAVRAWMKALPEKWIKVSLVEGQGYVLYVPCYSANGSLTLRTAPDSLPGIICEYCDSLDNYGVKSILHTRADSAFEFRLDRPAGTVRVLPVTDSLLKDFPEAPFKGQLLIWTRSRGAGKTDSMLFVPKSQETEFETLRAEDENPEGCGGDDPD